MSIQEQQEVREKYYSEAIRYMDNAKESLKSARKEDDFYLDKKMLHHLNSAYEILHLWGYYDGITDVSMVKRGFDLAYVIIEKIKPSY